MGTERVDKAWHSKGLEAYGSDALFGTLAHYGVPVTPEEFVALTREDFPLAIAQKWHAHWKGTGQFSRFPGAVAEELWRRFNSDEMAPTDLTLALINLLTSLDTALDKKADDGTWDTRFKVVDGYLARVPKEPLERHEKFMAEMVAALGEWLEPLDSMAEALAKEGQLALADRFAALEETLFPVRKGTATALVKAAKGDVEGAVKDLVVIAGDATRDEFDRLSAIDALFDCDRPDEAKRFTLELIERAEKTKDVDLASEVVDRMSRLLKLDPKRADRAELRARVEQLSRVLES